MNIVRRPLRGKPATPVDLDESFEDFPMPFEYLDSLSIQAEWVATSVSGVLGLEVSNHAFANNTGNELLPDDEQVWTVMPGSQFTVNEDEGNHMWDISEVFYEAVRVTYTRYAGTGAMSFYYVGKAPQ